MGGRLILPEEEGGNGKQSQGRRDSFLGDKLQRVLKTPECHRKFRINQQDFHGSTLFIFVQ